MKIGIAGAPGSGKTDFAHDLQVELEKLGRPHAWVLDDYVKDLRVATGLEYGGFGNHIDDLQVAFKRREWELSWRDSGTTTTCGTVLDSVAHCFVRSEEAALDRREVGLQHERLRTIASMWGLVYTDTWDYDYAFFLPYTGEERHSTLINECLRHLITTYSVPILTFTPEVSDDEKASTAASAIVALESDAAPEAQERGVRRGGEAGKPDGDPSESVSDVPEQGRAPGDA